MGMAAGTPAICWATETRRGHRRFASIDRQCVGNAESEWGQDGDSVEHAVLAAGVANGSCGSQLPLGSLRVAAVLFTANGAGKVDGPGEKCGRFHGCSVLGLFSA
jgi:hypothetical protein